MQHVQGLYYAHEVINLGVGSLYPARCRQANGSLVCTSDGTVETNMITNAMVVKDLVMPPFTVKSKPRRIEIKRDADESPLKIINKMLTDQMKVHSRIDQVSGQISHPEEEPVII